MPGQVLPKASIRTSLLRGGFLNFPLKQPRAFKRSSKTPRVQGPGNTSPALLLYSFKEYHKPAKNLSVKQGNINQSTMIYGEMKHSSHPDHMLKLEHNGTPYKCDGCSQLGFGSRFTCEKQCNFHLHKDCADSSKHITHPFFPNCNFVFLVEGNPNRYCDACGKDIEGFCYHCFDEGCGQDLHPCCASLPRVIEEDDMRLVLKKKVSGKCHRCGKKHLKKGMSSWSYVSACGRCHLHVSCVKEMLLDNWEKDFLGLGGGGDDMALGSRVPRLGIVLKDKKVKWRWFSKYKKIAKIAITFIMAAIVGDPTALVVGLIASFITH